MKISYNNRNSIESLYSDDQYVQVKTLDNLPKEVIEKIQLVSLPSSTEDTDSHPFGSYMNRVADYFGDIDVIQLYSGCCSIEEVGIKAAKAIQEMIFQIGKKKDHYFSEFKAGIDLPYYFDIGTLVEGRYRISDKLKYVPDILFKSKLLDSKEMEIISAIVNKPLSERDGNDYDVIFSLFREHYVLRWTEKEILQGWKTTSIGKYMLSKAVLDRTAVKIDMIMLEQSGKFIEVTNFFALGLEQKGEFIPINVDPDDLTPLALPIEIEKLYYSNEHYKPFKIVKRAFAFLKFLHGNWNKPSSARFSSASKTKMVMRGITLSEINENLDSYVQILKSTINIPK